MDQSANPSVFQNPIQNITSPESKKDAANWFKRNIVKILIAGLIILVAGELFFGGFNLFSPSTSRNLNILGPRVNPQTEAVLSVLPDKGIYKSGDQVVVDVKLFTGGQTTDSTDLVIKYDPEFLEPSQSFATPGQLYSEYPAVQIDKQAGLIGISGITLPGSNSFSGVGSFAKLVFKALKEGQTNVSADFRKAATDDSNVVLSGSSKDILGSVSDAELTISATETKAQENKGSSCEGFKQYCQDAQGSIGVQDCTGGVSQNGSCGYDPRFTVSCGVCQI